MIYQHVNWNPTNKDLRIFSAALACLLAVITTVSAMKMGSFGNVQIILTATGASVLLLGLILPNALHWPYKIWMAVMAPVGYALQTLLLLLFFYLILGSTGLIFRLIGKDPLERKFNRTASTYWQEVEYTKNIRSYFNQY